MTRDVLAGLDADGCGILHYASGNVLAVVSRVNGGKYTQLFDDAESNSAHVQLLAAFNYAGIGFANFRSGAHRLVTTKLGVLVLHEDGSMAQEYPWGKASPDTPLPSPIEFNLNAILSFRCTSKANIQVTLQRDGHFVFELGHTASRHDTYLSKVLHQRVDGSLVLDIHPPTLIQRQVAFQVTDPVKKAQRHNWALPRLSSSGREAERVRPREHLQTVLDTNNALVDRLNAFTTCITANVAAECHRQRQVPSKSFYSPISKPCFVPRAKVKRPIVMSKHLPRLHPQHLARFLSTVKSTQLVVVLCSNLSTSDCIAAEKMLAKFEHDWAAEDDLIAATKPPVVAPVVPVPVPDTTPIPKSPTNKPGKPKSIPTGPAAPNPPPTTPGASTDAVAAVLVPVTSTTSSMEITSLSKASRAEIDPAPERSQSTKRIVLVDCSTSTLLARRHNFSVYPMYLMYFGGQLGFCSNTFNGFGRTDVDFLLQVKTTLRNCQRNIFLPPTFRFP